MDIKLNKEYKIKLFTGKYCNVIPIRKLPSDVYICLVKENKTYHNTNQTYTMEVDKEDLQEIVIHKKSHLPDWL